MQTIYPPDQSIALYHLWFLAIELQYYLVWPVYFIFFVGISQVYGKRVGIVVTAFLGFASALLMPLMYQPGMDVTRLYYGTDTVSMPCC